MGINSILRGVFSAVGLDVRLKRNLERNSVLESIELWQQQWSLLEKFAIVTVLDIGANKGQFARMIRGVLPDAKIVSFEPLPSCFDELKTVISEVGNATCFNVGIGDKNVDCEMFLSSASPSSSLLPMNRKHKKEWPQSSENKPVSVKIKRLDDAVDVSSLHKPFAIKIDVQGVEDQVILGGEEVFKQAAVVVIETSFVPLYDGQPLFEDIYEQMKSLGFRYQGALDTSRSKEDHLILQEDSLFVRED